MEAKGDYDMTAEVTLGFVMDPTPPAGFLQFWSGWLERQLAKPPRFQAVPASDDLRSGLGVTHIVNGSRGVAIGTSIRLPKGGVGAVRGVVVRLHGYGIDPDEPMSTNRLYGDLEDECLAVVRMRVRGFPGSPMTPNDKCQRLGYAATGLTDPDSWLVGLAVADVCAVCIAAKEMFGRPVTLHGESFGGGLAVVATSALSGAEQTIERLVIGTPTLGAWPWRLTVDCGDGLGVEVASALEELSAPLRERAIQTLALYDAVTHAGRVIVPTLCKLAISDSVVPAPTAAAVFNALASDPGHKWRFITPRGHAQDLSTAELRCEVRFDRLAREFVDPSRPPEDSMASFNHADLEPGAAGKQPQVEPRSLFGEPVLAAMDEALITAYTHAGRTLDDLPYTTAFASLCESLEAVGREAEVWRQLTTLRKAGRLPRLGRSQSTPVRLDQDAEELVRDLLEDAVGSAGARDRLPYSDAFASMVTKLNAGAGLALEPYEVWRLVCRLVK